MRRCHIFGEEIGEVGLGLGVEVRDQGIDGRIGPDLGGVEEEFPAPKQPRLQAQINVELEEAFEDRDTQPLPDAGGLEWSGKGSSRA